MPAMSNLQNVQMLAHYRLWADRLTFEAVAALPPGEATRERPTLFKTIVRTLNHNYVIDLIWQAHLEGREHGFAARNVVTHPGLAELGQAQQKLNQWYIEWAERQSEQTLAEFVPFTFIGGEKSAMSRADMLLHVVNHASYHRGWVAEMFFQVPGAKLPATDLPVYLSRLRAGTA